MADTLVEAARIRGLPEGGGANHARRVVIKDDFLGGPNIGANTDSFFTSELLYRVHTGVDISQIYFGQFNGLNGVIEVNSDDASPTYIATDDFPFRLDKANMLFQTRCATSGGYGGSKYWSGLSDQEVLTPNNCLRFTWVTFGNLFAEIRRAGVLVASVDTGVVMGNSVFHTAELKMVSATSFEVWVDGVLKGTLNAAMPTVNLNYVIYAESPGGGQNAGNAVDFWALEYDR